ncbi:MAG: HAD family hydrolase [Acidobacteria bacterium]|nr:HAD family hydrolase [Acidobacteriota bacterium]
MTGRSIVVLDFDGVICDSVDECFASSFLAYYGLQKKTIPSSSEPDRRAHFARLRPFIRTGEDYLLIHELIDRGITVRDQGQFDEMAKRAGPQKMARFRELFYRARVQLFERDREAWVSMNRIYPHARTALQSAAGAPLHILSTKKPEFIQGILGHAGLSVPAERILHSGDEPKLPIVERIRADGGFDAAVFIDDQVDFLKNNPFPRVSVYLAAWGYVASEQIARDLGVPVLAAGDLPGLVARSLASGAFHGGGSPVQ